MKIIEKKRIYSAPSDILRSSVKIIVMTDESIEFERNDK